jgi:phosphoribosyl 1,2-cyclic phosphate phosphodiesterase
VVHGPLSGCYGYRLNDVAYLPDVHEIPPASKTRLRDLDLLILNCLRQRPHATHLSLEESLDYVRDLAPRRCLLTHMAHDIDYAQDAHLLPESVAFAYDGLEVQV